MSAIPVTIRRRMPSPVRLVRTQSSALGDPLVDTHGRVHRDLRVSLTDRCSLRCTYCMPEQGNEWLAKTSILSLDEIERVARVAATDGITTFRLTGGEPLLRADIVEVVRRLAVIAGPDGRRVEIAMTTNGIRLPELLPALIDAGLSRLNISIDTLRRDRFRDLTRRDRLQDVLDGIAAAGASSLRPLKLNAVAMRDVNDDELVELVEFIASVTAPFCGNCDRLRLTADGQLRNCLFSATEYDLLPILRTGTGDTIDAGIDRMLRSCVHGKLPGHAINDPAFLQPARGMNAIGG